jgi:hypothetical protein
MDIILKILGIVSNTLLVLLVVSFVTGTVFIGISFLDSYLTDKRSKKIRKHIKGYEKPTHWYDKFL